MEVDWRGKLKLNYTSCGCMLMEVDWGGKLIVSSMGDGELMKLTQMDTDFCSNHMNKFLLSEVDWGAHDSTFFLFLVNIHYDAKPVQFFTKTLWGELQQIMSSTPLIGHMADSLDTGQTEDYTFNPKPNGHELDDSEQLTGESI